VTCQKKQLEEKVNELQQRNTVISTINEGLSVERDALRNVVTEKNRKQQTLVDEIKQLSTDKKELTTQCSQLAGLSKQQSAMLLYEAQHKAELSTKLRSLYKQRHYLVGRVQQQQKELETLAAFIEQLKKEIHDLQQRVLGLNLTLLNQISMYKKATHKLAQMTEEVATFKKNNEFMTEQIKALAEQKAALATKVIELEVLEKELQTTKRRLETTVTHLSTYITEQKALILQQQQQVKNTLSEYQENQKTLDKTFMELEQVKKTMGLEMEQIKTTQSKLVTLVDQFSTQLIADKEKKQAFMEKLTVFLNSKEVSMEQFILGIQQLNQELSEATTNFKELNARHNEALKQHEELMSRLHVHVMSEGKLSFSEVGLFRCSADRPLNTSGQKDVLSM
jgi:chromosome segregation ATPase